MDLAFILYLKLKANGFGFYFLKRNPNPLDLDTFLIKSKFAILDFSFRQLKSRNPKPIQTFVARGADPRLGVWLFQDSTVFSIRIVNSALSHSAAHSCHDLLVIFLRVFPMYTRCS